MTEKRFWEIVRKNNWSRYWKFEKNCDICRQRMLRACTQDELKEFEDTASDMCSKLEERIKDYYQTVSNGKFDIMCPKGLAPHGYIGDNTQNDGLWHIVGKGKSVYDKVMKNPDEFWKVFGNVYRMVATECFQFFFFEDKSLPEDKQIQLALAAIRKQFGVDENTIVAKMDKMDKNMVDITFDDKHYKLMVWPEEDGYANVQIYKPTFGLDGLICTIVLKIQIVINWRARCLKKSQGHGHYKMKDYHCIHLNKVLEEKNDLYAINLILDSMGHENMNYMPIKDIMQFEKCIKKGQICFEYPEGNTIIEKQTMSLFIRHLAHCFLIMDIYSVGELLDREVVEKYLKIDFDLTYYEFIALWNGMTYEFRSFIERAAQFYFDAFYCLKLKKFPICSLYAKWILCCNCSVEDKNYSSFKSIIIK